MAKKLYPPYIEGTIPAFYGDSITIPYSMNRAVSSSEVAGFSLKIKTVPNNILLGELKKESFYADKVEFTLTDEIKNLMEIGQYYKVQLAYCAATVNENNEISLHPQYYSTVGVIKYTTEPSVSIEGLEIGTRNTHSVNYIGKYSQKTSTDSINYDETEKVYSYNFKIWDAENNLVNYSGELLHETNDEISYESLDEYSVMSGLEDGKTYYIQYTVTTTGGLIESSPRYKISNSQYIKPQVALDIFPVLNEENGYVSIYLSKTEGEIVEKGISGAFILTRRKENEPGGWEKLLTFSFNGQRPSTWKWKDFTVEQGCSYIYAIQQYSDELISTRIESAPIKVDFEHMFLYDGKKQLKIKYNPKISSFKTNLLETKVDTMGSKYPFILKNGYVSYKDFPISGLISYLLDEENLFINDDDFIFTKNNNRETGLKYHQIKNPTTNLTSDNFYKERKFKLEVLNWLNNGQPKLFRSPGEGNYIVRLMNNTLSPNDSLGRMLHNFNSNAYEIAECNYNNLYEYGFIFNELSNVSIPSNKVTKWSSVNLYNILKDLKEDSWSKNLLDGYTAKTIDFIDLTPGDKIRIKYLNAANTIDIVIGATGAYKISNSGDIIDVRIHGSNSRTNGFLTYSYETEVSGNVFGLYKTAKGVEVPVRQIFGSDPAFFKKDIIKNIQDLKTSILKFYYIDIEKRDIQIIYAKNAKGIVIGGDGSVLNQSKLYYDRYCNNEVDKNNLAPYLLYQIHIVDLLEFSKQEGNQNIPLEENQDYYYDANHDKHFKKHGAYLDGFTKKMIATDDYSTKFYFSTGIENSTWESASESAPSIDLNETHRYIIKDEFPKDLFIGAGLVATVGYFASVVTYNFEDNTNYNNAIKEYKEKIDSYSGKAGESNEIQEKYQKILSEYNLLLTNINNDIEDYKRNHGIV